MTLRQDIAGFLGLGADINKVQADEKEKFEGAISEFVPELKLDIDDKVLSKQQRDWKKKWNDYYKRELSARQNENERYWRGLHFSDVEHGRHGGSHHAHNRPLVDNLIFESLETFLPIITRQNPEPFVKSDDSDEGLKLSKTVQDMLVYQADRLRLRLKIKRSARFWALYFLGAYKVAWSMVDNDITDRVIRPQKLILDPDATISEGGEYEGEYIGEIRKDTAEGLIKRFPKKEKFITALAQKKLGTTIQYVEWWTDDFLFWSIGEEILDKVRNPHWNYEEEVGTFDDNGEEMIEMEQKRNHFDHPKKPYIFLSVYNLGMHPHDDTNIVEQNLPLQDLINKRYRQIDKNTDNLNGGCPVCPCIS